MICLLMAAKLVEFMRIDPFLGRNRRKALGAALLLCLAAPQAMAASFAIDPDPSSPTLGEMLEREARRPGQKTEPRMPASPRERRMTPPIPASREAPPRPQVIGLPQGGPASGPAPSARVVTAVPSVPRDASTVIVPRPPQRPAAAREIRRIDLSAARQVPAAISPEITSSIPNAADLRTEVLPLGDVPHTELVRVMRAAEFDAVRYPLRQAEAGTAVSITATPERVARLAQLIALLGASRGDTAVIAPVRPEPRVSQR